jgi:hypothetical protein
MGGCRSADPAVSPIGISTPPSAPISTPTSTATGVTTSTAPPSPSSSPTDDTATHAIARYYSAFNEALRSRQTTTLRATFKAGCLVCEQDADAIDRARLSGRTFAGGVVTVSGIRVAAASAPKLLVLARIAKERLIIKDSGGRVVTDEPPSVVEKVITLSPGATGWLIEGITQP